MTDDPGADAKLPDTPPSKDTSLSPHAPPHRRPPSKAAKAADFAALPLEQDNPSLLPGYYARFLVMTSLPYRDPGNVQEWSRRAFNKSLYLYPGRNYDPARFQDLSDGDAPPVISGFPYGIYARYIMAWITSEAKKTLSPILYTGTSLTRFMDKVGLPCKGGPRGTIAPFVTQFWRLVTCEIASIPDPQPGVPFHPTSFRIADPDSFYVWDDFVTPGSSSIAGIQLTLTEKCFSELVSGSVPYNPLALRALTGSSFQFDIYLWLTYRLFYLERETPIIFWKQLHNQFGTGISTTRQFRYRFLENLRYVLNIYSTAKVKVYEKGIKLFPSPPHVPIAK